MRVLTDDDVAAVLSLSALLDVVEEALRKQGRGEVQRPPRPQFPVGAGETRGTALTMPAAVEGAATFATKLVTVHESNDDRGLPTVRAQLHLTDANTGEPLAVMDADRLTNARTGCVGGLAARELADEPVRLGVFGAGQQARWQSRAIAAATDVERVRVYSPTPASREACAATLREEGLDADAVASADEVLAESNVVVTATTATEPVFDGAALEPGTLVVAVGAYTPETRELDATTLERAARVFADVPEEVAEIGDCRGVCSAADLVPFADVFGSGVGRGDAEEILVVESVGSAVFDAAAGEWVYDRARTKGVGTTVEF